MEPPKTVLFLCRHNAAKSVLAAAYFDRLAAARGLPFRADSAGTHPERRPSPVVVEALWAEGIDVSGHQPRRVTAADLARADRVVSLGCDPADLPPTEAPIERWDDVPLVSHGLEASRAAIRRHVEGLLAELAREAGPATAG